MKKLMMIIGACAMGGCATQQKDMAYLDLHSGADVVDAFVQNPYPDCKQSLEVARLDRDAMFRVYIDAKNGEVCK